VGAELKGGTRRHMVKGGGKDSSVLARKPG